jgi:hypothetical protein
MVQRNKGVISELLVLREGLRYYDYYDKTLFVKEVFDEMSRYRCYTHFIRTPNSEGIVSIEDIKFYYLVFKLKNLFHVLYSDIFEEKRPYATGLVLSCIQVLSKYIYFSNSEETNYDGSKDDLIKEEMFLLPDGLFHVSKRDFIENCTFNCPARSDGDDLDDLFDNHHPYRLPLILKEVDDWNTWSFKKMESFVLDKSYQLRDLGFRYFYSQCIRYHQKMMYGMIGCLSFSYFLHKTFSTGGGYIHPLQPFRLIQRPFLTVREQVLIVLMNNSSNSLYYLYRNFFEFDMTLGDFYKKHVHEVLRSVRYEAIALDDTLTEGEVYLVPSQYPEISCEQFIQNLLG